MRKLAITGGGGFVAGSVIQQASADWEVHALSGKDPLARRSGLVWHALDLKEPAQVRKTFEAIAPDVVIHAAAIGNIDYCENHPKAARVVNVGITESVAEYCGRSRARMIYLSTDNVFDGTQGNYVEENRPEPINEYARTKAASETIVSAALADAVIARLAARHGFWFARRGQLVFGANRPDVSRGANDLRPAGGSPHADRRGYARAGDSGTGGVRFSRRDSPGGKRGARPRFPDATPGRAARLLARHRGAPFANRNRRAGATAARCLAQRCESPSGPQDADARFRLGD